MKPIRILFLAASPKDTDRLRLDEEIRTIDERLRAAEFRERFELIQAWAVRSADLQDRLLRHKPDIVHFSGHGSEDGQIVLEDDSGMAQPVPTEALSNTFEILKDNIRCVVLNSCFSQAQASAIRQHIDCVVGMSGAVADRSAIAFAAGFYRGLGYGRSLETAWKLGANEIDLALLKRPDAPVLLTKPGIKSTETYFVEPEIGPEKELSSTVVTRRDLPTFSIISAVVFLYICVSFVSQTFESLGIVLDPGSLAVGIAVAMASTFVLFQIDGWYNMATRANTPTRVFTPGQARTAALVDYLKLFLLSAFLIWVLAQLVFTQ